MRGERRPRSAARKQYAAMHNTPCAPAIVPATRARDGHLARGRQHRCLTNLTHLPHLSVLKLPSARGSDRCVDEGFDRTDAHFLFMRLDVETSFSLYWRLFRPGPPTSGPRFWRGWTNASRPAECSRGRKCGWMRDRSISRRAIGSSVRSSSHGESRATPRRRSSCDKSCSARPSVPRWREIGARYRGTRRPRGQRDRRRPRIGVMREGRMIEAPLPRSFGSIAQEQT